MSSEVHNRVLRARLGPVASKLARVGLGLILLSGSGALAQGDRRSGIRFWNLTAHTITKFYLAPAGTEQYGPDQCVNDRDGTVDVDERLRITNVTPGRYDAKFEDRTGRVCVVRGIDIEAGEIFAIAERDLRDCR